MTTTATAMTATGPRNEHPLELCEVKFHYTPDASASAMRYGLYLSGTSFPALVNARLRAVARPMPPSLPELDPYTLVQTIPARLPHLLLDAAKQASASRIECRVWEFPESLAAQLMGALLAAKTASLQVSNLRGSDPLELGIAESMFNDHHTPDAMLALRYALGTPTAEDAADMLDVLTRQELALNVFITIAGDLVRYARAKEMPLFDLYVNEGAESAVKTLNEARQALLTGLTATFGPMQ